MARPCLHFLVLDFAVLAELSSTAAGGSGRALFERSEFGYWGQTPIWQNPKSTLRRFASHPKGEAEGSANLGSDP